MSYNQLITSLQHIIWCIRYMLLINVTSKPYITLIYTFSQMVPKKLVRIEKKTFCWWIFNQWGKKIKRKMYINAANPIVYAAYIRAAHNATSHLLFPGVNYWWFLVNAYQTPCHNCPVLHPLSHSLSVYCLYSPSSNQLRKIYSLSACPLC